MVGVLLERYIKTEVSLTRVGNEEVQIVGVPPCGSEHQRMWKHLLGRWSRLLGGPHTVDKVGSCD